MKEMVTLAQVEDRLITARGQSVLLDSDVAALYAVQTKEVNQAIKNNPDKFPEGYVIQLDKGEWQDVNSLRSKILTLENPILLRSKKLYTFPETYWRCFLQPGLSPLFPLHKELLHLYLELHLDP